MAMKNYIPVISTEDDYKLSLPATENPQPNGEPTPGVSERFAREDHVHPSQEGSGSANAPIPTFNIKLTEDNGTVTLIRVYGEVVSESYPYSHSAYLSGEGSDIIGVWDYE